MSSETGHAAPPATLPPPSFRPEDYGAFVGTLELDAVETMAVRAERSEHGDLVRTEAEVESSVAVDPDQEAVFYRYDLTARVLGEEDVEIASIGVSLVLVFTTPMTSADPEMVQYFGGTSAFMMAHPHLREAVNSLASRIGLPGVVLPIVRR